ncbi:RHS repeat-associated core domain-containing protein [Pseudoxanthomonas sacheonensis]|uniref:RHS repeat-associated protein n=1 Tax=Pseudoxanthomonas sacheonensis TaxID=443615 RepID=A0ABU1RTU3_9GAMM|nr:RHS repeat-associated core domain-containing protein [Pseudoxanthomonas sacheonensis]MDR6842185.1 RHS repeat-associated protein [Pseudoxanthomonas sacheonensis]
MKSWIAVLGLSLATLGLPLGVYAQTYTRTDLIVYHDNTTKWVLGQTASLTNTNTGVIESKTDYDSLTALPIRIYGPGVAATPGKLVQTLTYNADGTLATVKDGNNNVTTLSSWKRGIPQSIKYPITPESPTGAVQSAVVNDNGWITSVTDENGYKTCYGYDVMGRVNLITYPSETQVGVCDTSAWASTSITFAAAGNAAAYGMPAGHWRQTTLTGNGRKILIFDALWRPVVEQTLDLGNVSGTLSEVVKRYDVQGRVEFQSYPMNTNGLANYADTTLKGIWTDYDALDRVTSVTQDSELGLLTTLTEYLTGFKTRTTPPKGAAWQTTTSYQAYDQPSYDLPVAITHPEGAFTDITRDVFGKPTVLKRRNSTSSLAISRSYAYNANQELCRSVEPETGATLTGYDAAGNLNWSAAGLPATTACEANGTSTAVAARRADRTFDARNRVKTLSFPNGLGNTTYAYTPDGLPSSVVTNNGATDGQATLNYAYNKRRLITRETLITPQLNWPYDYGYNANGHLTVNNWHGLNIDYAPNALGQPTKAGTYASGVSYYPNGTIKQFTYGNGIVHTMTQNARQLPSRSTDSVTGSTPLDLGYAYDKHANVSGVTDYVTGARQTRGMTYDNLDRLTQTTSSMFGTAAYGYNVLDNLTTVNVAGGNKARNHAYVYDANNRLANVTTGVGGPTVIGLGYDVQGNLANKSGVLYSFDYGNRLRTVTDSVAAKTSTYAYDGLGRRVKDVVNGLAKHSQYTQNGQLVMVGDDRATDVSEYVYLQGSLLAIRVRDVPTATYTTKYQHTDALGTPIAVTSQSRTLLETSEYEPFGQQVNRVGAAKDGPGYTGHVQDGATGLTYMQQRYYDPILGRFLSGDPVGVSPINALNFNRYWYASNNPYKNTDPDGRCDGPSTCAIDRDIEAMNNGEMSRDEFMDRSAARAAGAVGGLTLLFLGRAALPVVGGLLGRQALKEGQKKISAEATRGIRSLEKRIAEHTKKLEEFKANPTVRPGMEKMSKEAIQGQQKKRIEHLEKEIKTFRENIEKLKNPPPPPPPPTPSTPSPSTPSPTGY